MLVIGPKNEGEVLLLKAHGFRNPTAIDLFSYSPLIRLMDMHRTDFADDTFAVVFCAWVVRYSYDIKSWAKELVRVSKNGAHVAIGFTMDPNEKNESAGMGAPLYGGLDELLGYFEGHVDHVYWRLEDGNLDESDVPHHTHSVVFRLKK